MKGMVLAAGLGTRLRPLTDRTPKPLVEVAGRPLIAYPLLQLSAVGVHEVVINVHHLADQMRATLGDGSAYGVHIRYSEETELLDTGGGIQRAAEFLADGDFFVLNSDSIHDVPLAEVAAFHRARGALVTMVLRDDPRAAEYGLVETDAAGVVRRLRGKPEGVSAPLRAAMYAGVLVISPQVLAAMKPGVYSIARDTIAGLIAAGGPVYGFHYDGYWRVVDTPADLALARRDLAPGNRVLSYLHG